MASVYAVGLVPLFIMTVVWIVVTGLHLTEAALVCAVSHHIFGAFALMVFSAASPELVALWLAVFVVALATIVPYWVWQIRGLEVRSFRDWLARNAVPVERLGSRQAYPHSREICDIHRHDHVEWEPHES